MPLSIYKRSYIMFNPEEKGCSLYKDKEVTGYLKVEVRGNRGRLTAALQNLNPEFSYNVKLLKYDDEIAVVDFGAVKVDDKGRGGAEWTFNVEDVKDTGIKLGEFSVAFVEANYGDKTLIPLASVIDKRSLNWKSAYKKYLSNSMQEDKLEEKSERDDRDVKDEEVESELPSTDENKENEVFENEVAEENIPGEEKNDDVTQTETDSSLQHEEKTSSSHFKIEEEEGYIKYLKEYVNNIVNFLEEVQPFEKNLEGYRWWKIKTGYKEGAFDHYLVGFVNGEDGSLKYIVYGMPGFFTLADQPFGGMTGFVVWKPVKENLRGSRDEGYWILHIDAKTGQIAVPIEPTPPPLV